MAKHSPDFLLAQHNGDFLFVRNGRKAQEVVFKPFRLQQKAKPVNGVFEVTLRRGLRAALKQEKVVLHLVGIQFGGQAAEM